MKTTIEIQNLKCGGCEATILKHLNTIKGIQKVSLDIENNTVSIDYESEDVLEQVSKVLARLGYPVVGDGNRFARKAKSYLSCALGRTIKE